MPLLQQLLVRDSEANQRSKSDLLDYSRDNLRFTV